MLAHFFNKSREYLGSMDMKGPVYDRYNIPVLGKQQVPIRLEEGASTLDHMPYRSFDVRAIYENGFATFLLFLEV